MDRSVIHISKHFDPWKNDIPFPAWLISRTDSRFFFCFQVAGVDDRFESKQRAVIEYLQYREVPSDIKRKVHSAGSFHFSIYTWYSWLSSCHEITRILSQHVLSYYNFRMTLFLGNYILLACERVCDEIYHILDRWRAITASAGANRLWFTKRVRSWTSSTAPHGCNHCRKYHLKDCWTIPV